MHMTDAHDKCTQHTSVIRFSRMSCVVFDLYALRAARLEHGGHTCRMQTISKHPMQALLKTHAQEPAVCIPKVEALEQDDAIKTKTHRKKVNEHRSCGNAFLEHDPDSNLGNAFLDVQPKPKSNLGNAHVCRTNWYGQSESKSNLGSALSLSLSHPGSARTCIVAEPPLSQKQGNIMSETN